jgi:hypothetical protein
MHYFEPTILRKALLVIAVTGTLSGCVSAPPTLQWWRVGDCLVLYDEREDRHMVVAGHQCDIRRQDLTNAHGVTRANSR